MREITQIDCISFKCNWMLECSSRMNLSRLNSFDEISFLNPEVHGLGTLFRNILSSKCQKARGKDKLKSST
jgi:hypothetical protein